LIFCADFGLTHLILLEFTNNLFFIHLIERHGFYKHIVLVGRGEGITPIVIGGQICYAIPNLAQASACARFGIRGSGRHYERDVRDEGKSSAQSRTVLVNRSDF